MAGVNISQQLSVNGPDVMGWVCQVLRQILCPVISHRQLSITGPAD